MMKIKKQMIIFIIIIQKKHVKTHLRMEKKNSEKLYKKIREQ